jgi:hypothetical protein
MILIYWAEAWVVASMEIGLEVNADRTKYVGKSISIGTGVIIFYGLAVLLSARVC